jgi:hypothetical protein
VTDLADEIVNVLESRVPMLVVNCYEGTLYASIHDYQGGELETWDLNRDDVEALFAAKPALYIDGEFTDDETAFRAAAGMQK